MTQERRRLLERLRNLHVSRDIATVFNQHVASEPDPRRQRDVDFVVQQAHVAPDVAERMLEQNNWDVVMAILDTLQNSTDELEPRFRFSNWASRVDPYDITDDNFEAGRLRAMRDLQELEDIERTQRAQTAVAQAVTLTANTLMQRRKIRLKAPTRSIMTLLDEHSELLPEGVYLEMANSLKRANGVLEELDPTLRDDYTERDYEVISQSEHVLGLERNIRLLEAEVFILEAKNASLKLERFSPRVGTHVKFRQVMNELVEKAATHSVQPLAPIMRPVSPLLSRSELCYRARRR